MTDTPTPAGDPATLRAVAAEIAADQLLKLAQALTAAGLPERDVLAALEEGYQRLEIGSGRRPVSVLQVPPGSVVVVDETIQVLDRFVDDELDLPAEVRLQLAVIREVSRVSRHDDFTVFMSHGGHDG